MKLLLPLIASLLAACPAFAQADKTAELERKLDILTWEVEQLKLGGPSSAPASLTPGRTGVPAGLVNKLSLGGYGELNAELPSRRNQKGDASGKNKTASLTRLVLAGEYGFTDAWSLKFEFEMENAGSGEGDEKRGEFEVEQAYVDYRHADWLTARAGHLLVPMGLVNLYHEPPFFHGVRRPSVEQFIIPSTWHENGVGLAGRAGIAQYQTYVLSGLKAINLNAPPTVDGFSGSNAIGGGRTEGSRSPIEDLAWVGRLDLKPLAGTLFGGSLYVGQADQGLIGPSVPVSLWEAHTDLNWKGAEVRGLFAQGRIGNADALNAANLVRDPAFTDNVGSRFFGGYAQAAFNALSLAPNATQYLAPFFRYERYDTQQRVPTGFANNAANSRVEYTLGLTYKPIPQLALKLDQQWLRNQARTGVNQWNLGVGFVF